MNQELDMRSFLHRVSDRKDHHEHSKNLSLIPRQVAKAPILRPCLDFLKLWGSEPYGLFEVAVPEAAEVDVVFVHGLHGHCRETWTKTSLDEPNCFWPEDLLAKDLSNARHATLGC